MINSYWLLQRVKLLLIELSMPRLANDSDGLGELAALLCTPDEKETDGEIQALMRGALRSWLLRSSHPCPWYRPASQFLLWSKPDQWHRPQEASRNHLLRFRSICMPTFGTPTGAATGAAACSLQANRRAEHQLCKQLFQLSLAFGLPDSSTPAPCRRHEDSGRLL